MKEYRRVLFDKTRLSCSSQNLRGCLSLQVSLTELKKKCFVHKKQQTLEMVAYLTVLQFKDHTV